jgi:hypothetical protein
MSATESVAFRDSFQLSLDCETADLRRALASLEQSEIETRELRSQIESAEESGHLTPEGGIMFPLPAIFKLSSLTHLPYSSLCRM